MTREERLTQIFAEFDRVTEEFCQESDGLFFEIFPLYKNPYDTRPQNLRHRLARIDYHSFAVEFKYTAHGFMGTVHSILECLVYLDRSEESFPIPLPLFLDYCGVDVTEPLLIPLISDPEGMRQAFACLAEVLRKHENTIAAHCESSEHREAIRSAFLAEIAFLYKLRTEPSQEEEAVLSYVNDGLYDFLTLRLTSTAFLCALRGDREEAVRQLGKVKRPIGYERRMLRIWQNEATPKTSELSHLRENAALVYTKKGTPKQSAKELAALFLTWFALTAILLPLYVGLYYLLRFLEGRDSVYLMTSSANVAYSFLFAFLTAIAASYFARFAFYLRMFPKDYARYREMDQIINGGGSDRFMKILLHVIILASLAGSVLCAKWNVNFLENGYVDNTKFFSVKGEYHSYDEVSSLIYRPTRVNGFDETLDAPSYVLVLKDGTELDFYQYEDDVRPDEALFEHLRKKGVPIDESQKP